MINLNIETYRDKVLGCWMGKNIGGTLGAPFEWRRQINQVDFYTQELGGDPLPNDDLDIQLLWLVALEEQGIAIDANLLAEYWCIFVTPHWAEYGNGKQNMRMGLLPPLSGSFNNPYKDSCGAFIRSEIWACIAPGCPEVAARYAYQDAVLDHGNGEGTYAEVFCAVMESAAFVENDLNRLIDIGLSYIPAECAVAQAAQTALKSYEDGMTWQEGRNLILEKFRGSSMGEIPELTSPSDREKSFDQGKRGWDVPSNIGMLVLGLAYGEGSFEKTICTAVNCGEDTDCTGATAGSIFGILRGYRSIPAKWIEPIGRKIKTACLNLGELGYFGNQLPQDVDDMTRRTEWIARRVLDAYNLPVAISDQPTDLTALDPKALFGLNPAVRSERNAATLPWAPPSFQNLNASVYRFPFYEIAVDTAEMPLIRDAEPKTVVLRVRNLFKVQDNLRMHWYLPEGWHITPGVDGQIQVPTGFLQHQSTTEVTFQLTADRVQGDVVRCAVELTVPGRPTVMLVPVTLVNGNYYPR